jgi:hypothetical protein
MFIGIGMNLIRGGYASPASLFAAGEQGAWYDPSDITTLFQDSAGTTPVTTIGQSVGRMLDKSGRGNHATQTTSAQRPTYQVDATGRPYLSFDGVDDGLVTAPINFSAIDEMTVFAGFRKRSDATRGMLAELAVSVPNSFQINVPIATASPSLAFTSAGSITITAVSGAFAAPITAVLTGQSKISTDTVTLRINGTQVAFNSADQGPGNYSNAPLHIGRRGNATLAVSADLYSLIIRGVTSAAGQVTSTESWVNGKTGAY